MKWFNSFLLLLLLGVCLFATATRTRSRRADASVLVASAPPSSAKTTTPAITNSAQRRAAAASRSRSGSHDGSRVNSESNDLPCPLNCSDNGYCNATTGKCNCTAQISYCSSDSCLPLDCYNHGACNVTAGLCACRDGFFPPGVCKYANCSGSPPCSAHGTCNFTSGTCICDEGFFPPDNCIYSHQLSPLTTTCYPCQNGTLTFWLQTSGQNRDLRFLVFIRDSVYSISEEERGHNVMLREDWVSSRTALLSSVFSHIWVTANVSTLVGGAWTSTQDLAGNASLDMMIFSNSSAFWNNGLFNISLSFSLSTDPNSTNPFVCLFISSFGCPHSTVPNEPSPDCFGHGVCVNPDAGLCECTPPYLGDDCTETHSGHRTLAIGIFASIVALVLIWIAFLYIYQKRHYRLIHHEMPSQLSIPLVPPTSSTPEAD
eukprot:gnl/Spiro4/16370_TR8789_c0_g1_i1.p1 gnl/Spiro4/16370_TR8789_c0_g1~~gnl/Spiro4/16370_TR8789_c0_g1_i1.p1  ORF type:complete len:430 (+),score=-6.89 gnl/Spiro4/16370_TR8789_c0_g1_i1:79-1368(+)